MRTYSFYAAITATTASAATIDIGQAGTIVGVDWTIVPSQAAVAAADWILAEVSFSNVNSNQVNDAQGIISQCGQGFSLTTSGVGSGVAKWSGPMGIEVKNGDRIYLNATENGANTWFVKCTIHVKPATR